MANPEHVAVLRKGATSWNEWRQENLDFGPELNGADLRNENLRGVDLNGADLRDADLSGAHLTEANLRANLSGANLNGANLVIADFHGADLDGADLGSADLRGAHFLRGNLRGASLTGAQFDSTIFADVDLSRAKSLETCIHFGPSTIGIDTIYKSKGEISEVFLRGVGVPEQFITYARSLVGRAIEFYSCFISYSSKDQKFAERLHADLRAKNLRVWFAPEDLKIGDRFQERIEESIHLYDKVMIILSDESVQSRWVEREINAAREREDRERRTVLFPVRIDDVAMEARQPWAADIRRSRHIGDFRGWKDHDSYQKAFERLLRDLRAEARPPSRV